KTPPKPTVLESLAVCPQSETGSARRCQIDSAVLDRCRSCLCNPSIVPFRPLCASSSLGGLHHAEAKRQSAIKTKKSPSDQRRSAINSQKAMQTTEGMEAHRRRNGTAFAASEAQRQRS
ncbi:MAG: hypothetical protein IJU66_05285, partial [Oscillospiraceae bacterium]|nr:hypothetical protein [Oscillospiraceae bacterium]